MDLELVPRGDDATLVAARLALAAAGVDEQTTSTRRRWWRAGVEEAVATRDVSSDLAAVVGDAPTAPRYAAPSPRRTRGATRA